MLRALDENGMEWRSNQLRIDLRNQIPLPNYRIRSGLSSILHSHERKQIDHSFIRILIPSVHPLPFDTLTESRTSAGGREIGFSSAFDHHKHVIGAATVTFRREDDGFLGVSAFRDEILPTWAGLMCHTLGFVAAQTMVPIVITRGLRDREDLSLYSGPFLRYASIMHSPVPFTDARGARDFWRLVELFFLYIEKQPTEPSLLLNELEGIRRGSQGSLQTACLTLGVGIESIAKLLLTNAFSSLICPPSIDPMLEYLEGWQGDASLKKRARGALSRLGDAGAAGLMYAWAERTKKEKGLVDAWKKLRHPRAHGETLAKEPAWSLYCCAIELLHWIVAYAIGYDGQILRTSQPGWGLQPWS